MKKRGRKAAVVKREPRAPDYRAGDHVFYVKDGEKRPCVVLAVHLDPPEPPYYSVSVAGEEKNTDHHHLAR